jgi:hypothetical protein
VSGGREDRRCRRTIDATEIKKMKADGMGQAPSRRRSKSAAHLSIEHSGIDAGDSSLNNQHRNFRVRQYLVRHTAEDNCR